MDGVRISRRVWWLTLLFWSLGLHGLGAWLFWRNAEKPLAPRSAFAPSADSLPPNSSPLETRVVSPSELRAAETRALVDSENAAPPRETPRDRARYLGERTQRVERESVAAGTGIRGGGGRASEAKPEAAPPASREERLAKFGLGPGSTLSHPRPAPPSAPGEGPEGAASGSVDRVDANVAVGTRTLLNTDEYVHAGFFNRVRREVAPRWEPLVRRILERSKERMTAGVYQTGLVTILDSEGNVLDVEIKKSSGFPAFDEAARSAIRLSLRFPRPPREMQDEDKLVRFELSFLVNLDPGGFRFDYVRDPRL